ncbi:hypothetical protein BJ742DRAFT_785200 [Cladochytrium replicatum]|nr:hypothetical protein BJ742DRAFT_785200 [Cladochytrium replicatum]
MAHIPVDSCPHLLNASLTPPAYATNVYKEECTLCFDDQDGENGIDVCLSCFNGGCLDNSRAHAALHTNKSNHPLAVNFRRVKKPSVPSTRDVSDEHTSKMIKLAIEPEREEDMYDFVLTPKCYPCGVILESANPKLIPVLDGILAAMTAKRQSEVRAWEAELAPCNHTQNLVQVQGAAPLGAQKCSSCDLTENLWLCLTCGNMGCGRKQAGGVSGNGHGMEHYASTGHPVACKLGTITPEGAADIYCYACDDEKLDPHLGKHLAHFGVRIADQQKTVKSLTELSLEFQNWNFNMTTEDGKELTPVFGPGLTGLCNLGNSCYMASVLQTVSAIPAFQEYSQYLLRSHVQSCSQTPATCFHCQLAKIGDGLLSGRYSVPELDENSERVIGQKGISPHMFKALVGKDHPEFSTMRQQDALEFLQHLNKLITQSHRRLAGGSPADPTGSFSMKLTRRLACVECQRVRYISEENSELPLSVPAGTTNEASVTLEDCFSLTMAATESRWRCGFCKKETDVTSSLFVERFPKVLVLPIRRFVWENYVPKKLSAKVLAPSVLDVESYRVRSYPAPGEELVPQDNESSAPLADPAALEQLASMGFSDVISTKAIRATLGGDGQPDLEAAINWIWEHNEDPGINDPIEVAGSGSGAGVEYSEGDVAMLMDMGFTRQQAQRGLRETSNNVERAVDWLFSHADEPMEEVSADAAPAAAETTDGLGKYHFLGVISHRGPSAGTGHYVAHVRVRAVDGEDKWVFFNDEKVVEVPDGESGMSAAGAEGYLFVYERI